MARSVNLIAAVGKRGQLGLEGRLPWRDPDDLRWFRAMTTDGHVVMGGVTYSEVFPLINGTVGRVCWGWGRDIDPAGMLDMIERMDPAKEIWIAGGARTYAAFMPFVKRCFISKIDYDGPADVVMPRLWGELSHIEFEGHAA